MSINQEYEKLIKDLIEVISIGSIYEYDIQKLSSKNKLFEIIEDHFLLLNKLFIKTFYLYCREKLFSKTKEKLNYSLCVLLINPNLSTAWSSRKKILTAENDLIIKEFQINNFILSKNFKCEQVYLHRRWLIKLAQNSNVLINENLLEFFKNEFSLINNCSKKLKQNYYCWTHFVWLCQHFFNHDEIKNSIKQFLDQKNIVYENPSDFSILHSRLYLLRLNGNNSYDFLIKELELIDDLVMRYPYYLTVWNYRKYFLSYFNEILSENFDRNKILFDFKNLDSKLIEVSKAVYSKTQNFDECNFSNTVFLPSILFCREIKLVALVNALVQSNQLDNFEIAKEHSSNFLKFIHKFIK